MDGIKKAFDYSQSDTPLIQWAEVGAEPAETGGNYSEGNLESKGNTLKGNIEGKLKETGGNTKEKLEEAGRGTEGRRITRRKANA